MLSRIVIKTSQKACLPGLVNLRSRPQAQYWPPVASVGAVRCQWPGQAVRFRWGVSGGRLRQRARPGVHARRQGSGRVAVAVDGISELAFSGDLRLGRPQLNSCGSPDLAFVDDLAVRSDTVGVTVVKAVLLTRFLSLFSQPCRRNSASQLSQIRHYSRADH